MMPNPLAWVFLVLFVSQVVLSVWSITDSIVYRREIIERYRMAREAARRGPVPKTGLDVG